MADLRSKDAILVIPGGAFGAPGMTRPFRRFAPPGMTERHGEAAVPRQAGAVTPFPQKAC
jgi:hypothetical protein